MFKPAPIAVTALLTGVLLSGCGGPSEYCTELENQQEAFSSLSSASLNIVEVFDALEDIGSTAPEEVADDWKLITERSSAVEKAMRDNGLALDDKTTLTEQLTALASDKKVDGVDATKLKADLAKVSSATSEADLSKAVKNIQKHATDECDLEIATP